MNSPKGLGQFWGKSPVPYLLHEWNWRHVCPRPGGPLKAGDSSTTSGKMGALPESLSWDPQLNVARPQNGLWHFLPFPLPAVPPVAESRHMLCSLLHPSLELMPCAAIRNTNSNNDPWLFHTPQQDVKIPGHILMCVLTLLFFFPSRLSPRFPFSSASCFSGWELVCWPDTLGEKEKQIFQDSLLTTSALYQTLILHIWVSKSWSLSSLLTDTRLRIIFFIIEKPLKPLCVIQMSCSNHRS